ncbi:proprotein convertase P-domain-containing protein [Marinobacter pelagius]|uniref:Regulatory P domain of the subtilisin-like proprotein convertase n=1 Tax=Marinobacter pelagius TaxID=379482 RepID=A0A1I4T396_9GAMM|nr:proprotein convertase P-domain-containing protein [Marinobacter pelagius]SFM71224.1 Regulatory P domain of the subtilisin-like proprotein convertase [Marinobacter pelagius]
MATYTGTSTDTPLAIDNGAPYDTYSYITISGQGTVQNANVQIQITHTNLGDIRLYLSDGNTGVQLEQYSYESQSGDTYYYDFDLSDFNGVSSDRDWELFVLDTTDNQYSGTLDEWTITLETGATGNGDSILPLLAKAEGVNFSQNIGSPTLSLAASGDGQLTEDYGAATLSLMASANGHLADGLILLPLEISVDSVTGTLSLPIEIDVATPETLTLPLSVTVYDASNFPGHNGTASGGTFAVRVEVGGQDYTSRLIGSIEVDAEEGSARVANFALVLYPGIFEPDEWINLPVTIDYLQNDSSFRIFTGIVDLPELSLEDNSIVLSCTDNRQGWFENKPRSAIEELFKDTEAKWSPAVFGDYETSDQFAEDLLRTMPASADLDRNGQLVFGQWYAPGFDFLFSDAETFPDSISVEWGSRRDIVTQVNIDAEYSYQFFRERKRRYWWEYPRSFGEYLEENTSLPTTSMIESAASADGWSILGKVAYERLPESGEYDLPGGGSTNWSISDDVRLSLAIAADFTIRKRWVQDVQESYAITVKSQANIERFGLISEDMRVSLDTSADETGFEGFDYEPDVNPTSIGSDTVWPTFDQSSIDLALQTAVAQAEVIIQESTRQNAVAFTTLIQPELELYHFVRLESSSVTAQGKCSRIRHVIDFENGSAVTDVELAIFRGDVAVGTSLAYDGLDYTETALGTFTTLYTKLQDYTGAVEPPSEAFQGYVGNYLSQLNNVPNPFDERFAILTPEISDQSRDAVEHFEEIEVEAKTYNQTMTVNL